MDLFPASLIAINVLCAVWNGTRIFTDPTASGFTSVALAMNVSAAVFLWALNSGK